MNILEILWIFFIPAFSIVDYFVKFITNKKIVLTVKDVLFLADVFYILLKSLPVFFVVVVACIVDNGLNWKNSLVMGEIVMFDFMFLIVYFQKEEKLIHFLKNKTILIVGVINLISVGYQLFNNLIPENIIYLMMLAYPILGINHFIFYYNKFFSKHNGVIKN